MARRGPDEISRDADVTPLDTADGQSTPPYGTIPPPPLSMHHVGVYVLILHRHTTNKTQNNGLFFHIHIDFTLT